MNIKKRSIFAGVVAAVILLAGCDLITKMNPGDKKDDNQGQEQPGENLNPSPSTSRAENLDFIFSTESVGKITITMKRSEWNQMLKNYDYFYKNENCVKFTRFEYEKDGKKWDLTKGGGIRLRGNTSRFRPQGKDSPKDKTGHTMPNESWSKEYYAYAKNCPDNHYRQSHFKVDFEEFLEDGDEQKLAGCMKGVALKRMDSSCTKEIFCYDLFHRFGIWTAPRASHTRVFFKFIEDNGKVTTLDYGVYEMFEEVNKQSLKARDKDENKASNAWKNSKGNLWKCAGGDLANPYATMYPEQIEITEFDSNGNPKAYIWDSPTYDLKTNKENVDEAASEFRQFILELNALPNVSNKDDTVSIYAIKAFYEKWMDVEFFLKSYAVNILVGMDDDYWSNANNYYLYFTDVPNGDHRKVYFIPFDYDNTLGASIKGNHSYGEKEGIEQNPLNWGRGANRPLMDKLLQVPEYRQLFKDLIKEVSSPDGEWNYKKCSQRWYKYWDMVDPYLNSPDLSEQICTKRHGDNVYKPWGYSLVNQSNNLYDYTRSCFMSYIREPGEKFKFDLNGGNIDGNTDSVEVEFSDSSSTLSSLIQSPKKAGYIFVGWTRTKNGEDYQVSPDASVLYARWKKISEIKDLFIYELEPGMEGYKENYEGIQIRILNPPSLYKSNTNESGARVRQIYVNGVKVTDVSNSDQVVATTWGFPYTDAGKTYTVQVKYLKSDYWSIHSMTNEISIKAKSGKGKFTLETNVVGFNVLDNIITFTPSNPEIYVAGERISSEYNPGYYEITFHDPNWVYSVYPRVDDYKLDSFNVLDWISMHGSWAMDMALESPIQTSMIYMIKNENDDYGNYRLDVGLSGMDFRLIDTRPKLETVQDDEERPGIVLKFPVSKLPESTSIRRIRVNNNLASDIRSYSEHEGTMVWSEEWYYPFVDAGKEYTFSVEYLDKDWNQVLKLPDLKVKATSGMGEIQVVQSPEYRVIDNVIEWTKQPVMSMGGKVLTQEDFAYYNRNGDKFGYKIALNTNNWSWCFDKVECSYELESFDVLEYCKEHNPENASKAASNPCFIYLELVYGNNWDVNDGPYGRYEYEILSDKTKMNFTLSE